MSIGSRIQSALSDPTRVLMVIITLVLVCTGVIMVYSASMGEAFDSGSMDSVSSLVKDLLLALGGIASGVFIYFVGSPSILRSRWLRAILTVLVFVLIVATAIVGTEVNGAKRWIDLGFARLQPVEFIKICFVVNVCSIFADYREDGDLMSLLGKFGLFIVLPLLLLFSFQSDLGSAIIISVGIVAALGIGGVKMRYIFGILAVVALVGIVATLTTSYRSDRMYFSDPWSDGQNGRGNGLQLIRSFYAFAKGGLLGVGPGSSTEKLVMPEAETDFIYAIIGEEFGFIGAVAVAILFFLLLVCGLTISNRADNFFACTLSGGLAIMLAFQAFLNMGCVVGIIPTTGKPLPFLSSGGSSMVASIWMVSLILAVTRTGFGASVYDRRRDNLRILHATGSRRPSVSQGQGRVARSARR